MLVLSRKLGEQIVIGGNIVVTIVDINGKHIKLGIDAPDGIRVLRLELVGRAPRLHAAPVDEATQREVTLGPAT